MTITNNSTKFFNNLEPNSQVEGDLIIIAYKLQTPENIGSIIRLGANIGCSKLIFLNPNKTYKEYKIKRVGGRAADIIDWQIVDSEDPFEFLPHGYELVALETYTNATNIYQTQLPPKMALLVGAEDDGVPIALLERCSKVVYIPLNGPVQSMNVAQATGVAMFEWARQRFLYL